MLMNEMKLRRGLEIRSQNMRIKKIVKENYVIGKPKRRNRNGIYNKKDKISDKELMKSTLEGRLVHRIMGAWQQRETKYLVTSRGLECRLRLEVQSIVDFLEMCFCKEG